MEFTFSQEPQDTVTVQGGTLQLDCQARSDAVAEPPAITWRKDGVLLSTMVDERRRQLANGSLLVQNVMHSRHHRPDEGQYQCLATLDGVGSIVSRVARVTVAGKRLSLGELSDGASKVTSGLTAPNKRAERKMRIKEEFPPAH